MRVFGEWSGGETGAEWRDGSCSARFVEGWSGQVSGRTTPFRYTAPFIPNQRRGLFRAGGYKGGVCRDHAAEGGDEEGAGGGVDQLEVAQVPVELCV